ncbi:hypothetical protein KKF61_09260 [Patescibacteria group bacterium]|nr:hypothetical protein [Patescibacteria group bacterium]
MKRQFNIPKTIPYRVSESATPEELARGHRKNAEELARRTAEVAEHLPGSKFDEVEFTSLGEGREVRIENPFDWIPNRRETVSGKGAYLIGNARSDLADKQFIYLTTNAPKGTKFIVRVWRV